MCVDGNVIFFFQTGEKILAILRDVHIHLYCKKGECAPWLVEVIYYCIFNCHSLTCHVQLHICFIYDDDDDKDYNYDDKDNISDVATCYLCTGVFKFIMREQ